MAADEGTRCKVRYHRLLVRYHRGGVKTAYEVIKMQITRDVGPVEGFLQSVLAFGKEAAVTRPVIAGALGYKRDKNGARRVSMLLEAERVKGAVILSDSDGVYLPSRDPEQGRREVEHYIRLQSARARGCFRSLRSAKLHLRRLDGQTELDLTEDKKS